MTKHEVEQSVDQLQPGDYVVTDSLTCEETRQVVQAFCKAGAKGSKAKNGAEVAVGIEGRRYLGWDLRDGEVYCNNVTTINNRLVFSRQRSLDEVLAFA
jgi:hypothetical protein